MKKYLLVTTVMVLFIISCRPEPQSSAEKITTIGIINPTVGSLRGFKSMVEKGVINIPGLRLLAVCFDAAERDFDSVEAYIKSSDNPLFAIKRVAGQIHPDSIFTTHHLSREFREIFNQTDGLFFLGGADFPPFSYGQKTSLMTGIYTPNRHYFELSLLYHLTGGFQDSNFVPFLEENPDYAVIGFCLGMQSMNVASGGTMFQDISTEVYGLSYVEDVLAREVNQRHKNYWQNLSQDRDMIWANFHQIVPVEDHSFFSDAIWQANSSPFVYSSHHQAARDIGKNFAIIATSMDGKIPEIIAHTVYPNVIGVQFHPEVADLYNENGPKLKWYPTDPNPVSYYTFLSQNSSLPFHLEYWKKISELFTRAQ